MFSCMQEGGQTADAAHLHAALRDTHDTDIHKGMQQQGAGSEVHQLGLKIVSILVAGFAGAV